MNKAVFLDRDGVINVDYGYVHEIEHFKFIPGAKKALRKLSATDYKVIVITDQSGIGRGYYTEEDAKKVNNYMINELSKEGATVSGIYYCPHAPEANCRCRKPKIFLLQKAKRDFNIDLSKSYFIGDKTKDIQTGINAGCKTIIVMTGKAGADKEFDSQPDFTARDLLDAVDYIIQNEQA